MEAFDVYRPASIRRDMTYTSEPEWHLPPWTDDEVANINDYQRSGEMHPLTCGCDPAISASNTEPHQDDWDF
ncbi:hypothetical protein [Mycolicibacterium grossiae]|jgi:hypothetical protein|uniref:hypothetical protein n=2 Tax=Mycobacteriaceae TaxID=1762 RepID=UPI000F798137|nr:hypothetical protein [Mycolicibacterium grossiae]